MSVIMTERKMIIILSKVKNAGLNIPFLATSIMPLEKSDPANTPSEAITKIVRNEATLDPIAEFRKLTASLLTPTTRSTMANENRMKMII